MTAIASRVPHDLTSALVDLLVERHRPGIVAALLALIDPHVAPRPRPADADEVVLVDMTLFRRLACLLGSGGLFVDVLDTLQPWLTAPRSVDEYAAALDKFPTAPATRSTDGLSTREMEVLAGMAAGRSNGAIGSTLFLSEDTIKTYARKLFRKLGAHDRAHAVRIAFDLGYLTPATPNAAAGPARVA
jgi:DNA-binding CsgD family transcriptional regulator